MTALLRTNLYLKPKTLLVVTLHLLLSLAPISAHGSPVTQRGFLVPLEAITQDSLSELKSNWGINIIRVPIGNNTVMDGVTGAAYDSMLEDRFTLLDQKLPLISAAGLKIIFCLVSPPGGYLTRQSPSHYRMYSEPALQEDYINKWRQIVARYGNDANIFAFDLENEPAVRNSLLASGARNWNVLVVDTIKAIRETHPNIKLVVKSMYGDPSKLASLPAINDSNVIYSYNSYFYNAYQHTGIQSTPFSINRPSDAAILANMRRRVAPFFLKTYLRAEKGEIPANAYPPQLMVGEVAVSACAIEAGQFLQGVVNALETDRSLLSEKRRQRALNRWKRNRKRNKRLPKPRFTALDFADDVKHINYTFHAFGEYQFWDPRYSCDNSGNLSLATSDTDRATAIKSALQRNE
jgi:hypothetical protein